MALTTLVTNAPSTASPATAVMSTVGAAATSAEATPAARMAEESLFDRVQRFAADGVGEEDLPVRPGGDSGPNGAVTPRSGNSVSERMAALRELQGRT